jgi:hypothetical protein
MTELGLVGKIIGITGLGFASIVSPLSTTVNAPEEKAQIFYQQNDKKESQYNKKISAIEDKLLKEAKALTNWCEKNKLNYELRQIAETILAVNPENDYAKQLLGNKKKEEKVSQLTVRVAFADQLQKICEKYSKQCSDLAGWCKTQKLDAEREKSLDSALKLDPDNKAARKARNQAYVQGYGWLDMDTAKKIGSGLREFNGKWIPKADRDALGKEWKNALEFKSEHFTLKTNTTEEEGLECPTPGFCTSLN